MNHVELNEMAEWVLIRWPAAKAWTKAEAFHSDFAEVDLGTAIRALTGMYQEGRRFAPTPSEVMVRAKRPADGWQGRPPPETCPHVNWAILEYETERDDGKRFAVCASCLTERLASPKVLLNSAELEARAKARAEDRALTQ